MTGELYTDQTSVFLSPNAGLKVNVSTPVPVLYGLLLLSLLLFLLLLFCLSGFEDRVISGSLVTEAGFEFLIVLLLPPGCWDHWCAPPGGGSKHRKNLSTWSSTWFGPKCGKPRNLIRMFCAHTPSPNNAANSLSATWGPHLH